MTVGQEGNIYILGNFTKKKNDIEYNLKYSNHFTNDKNSYIFYLTKYSSGKRNDFFNYTSIEDLEKEFKKEFPDIYRREVVKELLKDFN